MVDLTVEDRGRMENKKASEDGSMRSRAKDPTNDGKIWMI